MKKYLKISLDDFYGLEEEQRKQFLDDLCEFGKRHKLSIDLFLDDDQKTPGWPQWIADHIHNKTFDEILFECIYGILVLSVALSLVNTLIL